MDSRHPPRSADPADALFDQAMADAAKGDSASPRGAGAGLDGLNHKGWTPLTTAARLGQAGAAAALIAAGARVDFKDGDGFTPLVCAARYMDLDMARLLLEAGADPSLPNGRGQSAASWAARSTAARSNLLPRPDRSVAILELLDSHGADLRAPDPHGATPLEHARRRGNEGAAQAIERLLAAREARDIDAALPPSASSRAGRPRV